MAPVASSPFVWFDFGGVLSPPLEVMFADYQRKTGIDAGIVKRAIATVGRDLGAEPLAPIELGILSERSWVDLLHAAMLRESPGLDVSRSELDFGRQWFAGHRVNERVRSYLLELRGRSLGVGILSNNVVEWEPYWRPMVGLDGEVDDIVDSCKVGCRKPDRRIFELAAERNGLEPEACVLLDDLEENCEAARSAGWTAVTFVDNHTSLAELDRRISQLTGILEIS